MTATVNTTAREPTERRHRSVPHCHSLVHSALQSADDSNSDACSRPMLARLTHSPAASLHLELDRAATERCPTRSHKTRSARETATLSTMQPLDQPNDGCTTRPQRLPHTATHTRTHMHAATHSASHSHVHHAYRSHITTHTLTRACTARAHSVLPLSPHRSTCPSTSRASPHSSSCSSPLTRPRGRPVRHGSRTVEVSACPLLAPQAHLLFFADSPFSTVCLQLCGS